MDTFPNDWTHRTYSETFTHHPSKPYQVPACAYACYGQYPVIDQGKNQIIGYTDDATKVLKCPSSGMIVFGDHTRIVKFVDFDFSVGADGTQLLTGNGCETRYLYYYLQQIGIPNLGYSRHFKYVKEFTYTLPPLPEQRRIVEALESIDKLIDNLARRIVKKRMVKQGVMQDLLTGKKRLSGFSEKWEERQISESLDAVGSPNAPVKWKALKTPIQGLFPAFSASGQDVWTTEPSFHEDGIVVSAVGSHCGKVFLAIGDWGVVANTHVILAKNGAYIPFWFYILNNENWWIKGGSGQPYVMIRPSLSRTMPTPPPEEQRAIASVLRNMDADIEKLEAKREKYERIKQGMMHDLLTGKVRI